MERFIVKERTHNHINNDWSVVVEDTKLKNYLRFTAKLEVVQLLVSMMNHSANDDTSSKYRILHNFVKATIGQDRLDQMLKDFNRG